MEELALIRKELKADFANVVKRVPDIINKIITTASLCSKNFKTAQPLSKIPKDVAATGIAIPKKQNPENTN